eukprot:9909440-Prorocentrum_lima.AAC.1
MTSSLVGSEMCIRDRSIGASRRPGFRHCGCRSRAPLPSRNTARCRRRRCLLYTSDAADDM